MTDAQKREKVIRGLECCLKFFNQEGCPEECPYRSDGRGYETIKRDALALLREQEPVKPLIPDDDMMRYCGNCGEIVGHEVLGPSGLNVTQFEFCPKCGRKVKWDET